MGRRKIEIQPITHERNRSVTFLKRKNGLFKKAYELGVLCSVDVAVIIFEERPGHHVKLFQYCSTDVNSMVQRHLRFDGERDTRGPPDFSGNTKHDNAEDEDEDGDDDDGTRASKARQAPNKAPKVKMETTNGSLNINGTVPIRPVPQANSDLSMIDLDYRISPTGATSSIPVSGERLSAASPPIRNISHSLSSKRPRLDDGPHLPSHANSMPALPQSLNLSSLAPSASGSGGLPHYPYRLEVDMSSGYPVQTSITPLPSAPGLPPTQSASHPSLQYGNGNLNFGMNVVGSGGILGSQSAPAGFLPQFGQGAFGMDLGGNHNPPTLRTVNFPGSQGHSQAGSASPFTPQQTSAPAYQQQQRQSAATAMALELLSQATTNGADGGGGGQGGLSSFDWPVHGNGQQSHHENGAPQSQSNADANNNNWFDLFSGPGASSNPQANSLTSLFPTTAQNARGVVGISSAARAAAGFAMPVPVSMPQSQASSPGVGQKRPREDDAASVHSMHSVHSVHSIHSIHSGQGERQRSEERGGAGRRSVSADKPPS